MFINTRQMPSVRNMSATGGTTIVLDLPLGEIYHSIKFLLTNVVRANLTDIKVYINNRVVQEYATGTVLQGINDFYGRPSDTAYMTLHFERPEMQEALEGVTCIGTNNIQEFRIEMTVASGLTDAAISASAEVRTPTTVQEGNLGYITRVAKINLTTSSGVGDYTSEIIRGDDIIAVHFNVNDITNVQVIGDSRVLYENEKVRASQYAKAWGRVYGSGLTQIDFCLRGRLSDALVTRRTSRDGKIRLIQDLIWRITDTSGSTFATYVEYLRDTALDGV